MRTYNDAPYIREALQSALDLTYKGRLQILVGLDAGSPDTTAAVVTDMVGGLWDADGRPMEFRSYTKNDPLRQVRVVPHPHMTLAAASRHLLPMLRGVDEIVLLDGDNTLRPDRLQTHVAAHPDNIGLCCCRVLWGMEKGSAPFPNRPAGPVPLVALLMGNFLDTLAMRWNAAYLLDRILPLVEHEPAGDLVDDYLMALLAARDGRCDLHDLLGGSYRFREDSLTKRTDVGVRTVDTVNAYHRLAAAHPPLS